VTSPGQCRSAGRFSVEPRLGLCDVFAPAGDESVILRLLVAESDRSAGSMKTEETRIGCTQSMSTGCEMGVLDSDQIVVSILPSGG
jgi:hypothetical protein